MRARLKFDCFQFPMITFSFAGYQSRWRRFYLFDLRRCLLSATIHDENIWGFLNLFIESLKYKCIAEWKYRLMCWFLSFQLIIVHIHAFIIFRFECFWLLLLLFACITIPIGNRFAQPSLRIIVADFFYSIINISAEIEWFRTFCTR